MDFHAVRRLFPVTEQMVFLAISLRGGRCRVSPGLFTSEDEIDRTLAALG
jgi:selenocysteine lyase/cysteine desulfurase